MPSFSTIEISRMAPVGQTWLQRVQFSSHQPILEIMIGVQSPSSPASNIAGCRTLVGQTRMHWSHLMHRRRNSSSATEPGGRMTYRLKFFSDAAGESGHREEQQAEEPGQDQLAAADRRLGHLAGLARQEPE